MSTNTKKNNLPAIKRIKESITEIEFKRLINGIKGDDSLKLNSKTNLIRAFTILYFTGLRLNEVQELRLLNIKELLEFGSTKIVISKTKSERKLFAGQEFQKHLKKLFDINCDDFDLNRRIIVKASNNNSHLSKINNDVFIAQVNKTIKSILGEGYTSHSFRQGIITEMGSKGINTKIISKFIGHSDIKTTMRYIKPTDDDVRGAMVR